MRGRWLEIQELPPHAHVKIVVFVQGSEETLYVATLPGCSHPVRSFTDEKSGFFYLGHRNSRVEMDAA